MKDDMFHRGATWLRDEAAQKGTHFAIKQGDGKQAMLTQMEATINGIKGVVEYIVDEKGISLIRYSNPGK